MIVIRPVGAVVDIILDRYGQRIQRRVADARRRRDNRRYRVCQHRSAQVHIAENGSRWVLCTERCRRMWGPTEPDWWPWQSAMRASHLTVRMS